MTWKHLEADKVGVLVADHSTIHENIVMLEHKLTEALDVERSTHAYEQLRVLQIGRKSVEYVCIAAIGLVKVVKLLYVIVALHVL